VNGQTATQAYYAVVFHEIIHWSGDVGRLGRKHFNRYAEEELVAEMGAVILMRHFGMELGNPKRHAAYIQGWLDRCYEGDAPLRRAKVEAAKAVRYILERGIIGQ
jgi:antirestriction protein ArdC